MGYVKSASTILPVHLNLPLKWLLGFLCLLVGLGLLAGRWLPGELAKLGYGLLIAGILLVVTLSARARPALRQFWQLSFAFFVFAVVQVLNNAIPPLVTNMLHEAPTAGNPLAASVSGTVVIQLIESAIAVVPIIWLTRVAGLDLRAIYASRGRIGGAFLVSVAVVVLFALFTASGRSARMLPTNGALPFSGFIKLAPALVVLVISNGFQEEFLFRGLFLQRYEPFFGARTANVLQAAIFTVAHAGISYTPSAIIFNLAFTFPLGLITGYLMRRTNGVLTPAIFHAGVDIPIYFAFLTFAV